jgi:hypothetical protein
MSKRLYASATTGAVCIVEGGSEDYINNPQDHLDKVYFHSNFNYVSAIAVSMHTINHTAYTESYETSKGHAYPVFKEYSETILLTTHDLGYKPYIICHSENTTLASRAILQQVGYSARYANLRVTEEAVYLDLRIILYAAPLPSFTSTYNICILRVL